MGEAPRWRHGGCRGCGWAGPRWRSLIWAPDSGGAPARGVSGATAAVHLLVREPLQDHLGRLPPLLRTVSSRARSADHTAVAAATPSAAAAASAAADVRLHWGVAGGRPRVSRATWFEHRRLRAYSIHHCDHPTMGYNVTLQSEIAYSCNEATANQMKPRETSVGPLTIGVTKAASFSQKDRKSVV